MALALFAPGDIGVDLGFHLGQALCDGPVGTKAKPLDDAGATRTGSVAIGDGSGWRIPGQGVCGG